MESHLLTIFEKRINAHIQSVILRNSSKKQNNSSLYDVSMSFLNCHGPSYPEYNDIQNNSDISSANAECANADVPTLSSIWAFIAIKQNDISPIAY